MKKIISLITLAALLISCVGIVYSALEEDKVDLVKDGQVLYSITYSGMWTLNNNENLAVAEGFRDALAAATGSEVNLYSGEETITDKEIYVGNTDKAFARHKDRVALGGNYTVDEELIGPKGFVITSTEDRYILAASTDLGAWGAVSYFMNEVVGYDINNPPAEPIKNASIPAVINYINSEYLKCDLHVIMTIGGVDISEYKVVCSATASTDEIETATNFRRYVYAMTGVDLDLVRDTTAATEHEIVIGDTTRYDVSSLAKSDVIIKSENGSLIIAGDSDYGTNYANELFFAKYASVVSGIYTGNSVLDIAGDINDNVKMPFNETIAEGVDYAEYTRDNIAALLGTEETPCYSDSAVADKLYDALKAKNPAKGDTVMLISNTADYCKCDKCKGETKAFIETASKVADKFAADGVTVGITAINETRKPAVDKVSDNLRIFFAEPYICCAHAINDDSCETNKAIAADLAAWTAVASDVYVVDFTMNYHDYPSTFPNIDTIYPNINYYSQVGAEGVIMAWEKNSAALEFGEIRYALINAALANPAMSADEFTTVKDTIIDALYGKNASAIKNYIEKFDAASAEHFNIFSKAAEILPIAKIEGKTGADAYDLTLAKELGKIWNDIYERHNPPEGALTGLAMFELNKDYIESDYYLPLHSRVQYTEWLEGNIPSVDRHLVYTAIIESFN